MLRDNNSSGKDISGNDTGLSDALRGEQNVEESHLNLNTMDEVRKGNVGSNEIKCPRVSLREQLLATPPVSPVTSNENASRQRPLGTLMGTVVGGYDSDDPINMSNLDDNWKSQCSISSDTQTPSHAHTQTDVWTESSSVSETDISVNSIRRSRSSTHNKMKAYKGKLKSSCSKRNMKVDQSHNEHQEVSATLEPLGKGWHVVSYDGYNQYVQLSVHIILYVRILCSEGVFHSNCADFNHGECNTAVHLRLERHNN